MARPTSAAQDSWFKRHWKWVVAGVFVLFAVFAFVVFSTVTTMFRNSDPYQHALARARASAEVVAVLGEPIETGWLTQGSIQTSGPSGEASLAIPVSGPRGAGTVYVQAEKEAGEWSYELVAFRTEDGETTVDLLEGG